MKLKATFLLTVLLIFSIAAISLANRQDTSSDSATPKPVTVKPPVKTPAKKPIFRAKIRLISADERTAMLASGSWRPGCPLSIDKLRVIELRHIGFDKQVHSGKLMVNQSVTLEVTKIFHQLFDAGYPIHQMKLVDEFDASDEASMVADNSSGYNCRRSPLDGSWSRHSYGLAIDINPFENPEVLHGTKVDPPQSKKFVDRSLKIKGVIRPGDQAVTTFAKAGWAWGGNWQPGWQDWQHFYKL